MTNKSKSIIIILNEHISKAMTETVALRKETK